MAKAQWLLDLEKKSPKKGKKKKPKGKKAKVKKGRRPYTPAEGVVWPVYVFKPNGKRLAKIDSVAKMTDVGFCWSTLVGALRDGSTYKGHYVSYNKSI